MKWNKYLLCLGAGLIITSAAMANTFAIDTCINGVVVQDTTFAITDSVHYKSSGATTIAGGGTSVTLAGNNVTGAKITFQSVDAVTINGAFTVQLGATLKIRSGSCDTVITARSGFAHTGKQPITKTGNGEWMAYPNPAGNMLTVYLPDWDGRVKKELTITDLSGRLVKQQTLLPGNTVVNVSALQRGNYMLIISGPGNTQQAKKLALQ